jgi:acetylornithine deacetylase/succinyl-diaminopimelate desuccinylase-like protein
MTTKTLRAAFLFGAILSAILAVPPPLSAQSSWFQPALLERADMRKALQSVDDRASGIVDEWIKLVEIPAPSGKERARAQYVKAELEKLGLSDVRTDDIWNVSGVRKGTGGGPTVVFAAHMDTVFPEGTDLKVKRDGDILRAPGVGDDTSNLMAVLEMFRALNRGAVQTKGDLIFLATVQEEMGLLGAKHWLEKSGHKPDMFVAVDVGATDVWYGALRINMFKFFFTSPGAHTLESRDGPSPARAVAKAIESLYAIPLPALAPGLGTFKVPVLNVGMLGGGTVNNAVPREAWFTVDLRSLDTETQNRLKKEVVSRTERIAKETGVGFRMEELSGIDYSKARPQPERLNHGLVQTALATANHFRKPGTPAIVAADLGSTDANIAVSMGIPAVAIGASANQMPHRLEESADARAIVPGIKSLIALAVALTTH